MVSRSRVVTLAVCVTALTAMVGLAAFASAGKRLKTKAQSTTIDGAEPNDIEEATLTPKCKRGTKAVSGGFFGEFDADAMGGAEQFVLPSASRRAGKRKWTGTAANLGPESAEYTVFAYCRDQKKVKSNTKTVTAPGYAPDFQWKKVRATARCPRGTKVLSGGFEAPTDLTAPDRSIVIVTENRRLSSREWTVAGAEGAGETGQLTAQVNCSKKRLKERTASRAFPSAGPGGYAEVTAKCKRSQRLVSGGFSSPDLADGQVALVYGSRKEGRRKWVVNAYGRDTTLTAHAYCEKK